MKKTMKKIIYLALCLLVLANTGLAQKSKSKKGQTPKKTSPVKPPAEKPPLVLSKIESEILAEVNALRTDPQSYIGHLEQMKRGFRGNIYKNAQGVEIITFDGVGAVEQAIGLLKKQTPLPVFKISTGLMQAAALHLRDMAANDFFSHRGSDQSLPDERAAMFGSAPNGVNQNITQGSTTAREIVLQMLVSDGLQNRIQRQNLLNPQLQVVGIAAGEARKGYLCVLMLADSFKEKS
jgi:hypothetical protein